MNDIKLFSRILNIVFYIVASVCILSSLGAVVLQKPLLYSAIKSNSMYPLFQRGDLVIISPGTSDTQYQIGDIIVFNAQEGDLKSLGWISHRIIGGDMQNGFATKGDANDSPDQKKASDPRIKTEWICGKVVTVGQGVLKVPLVGFLSLWMEDFYKEPYAIPVIAVLIAIVIFSSELVSRKKKKNMKFSYPAIYFLAGMALSAILCASMLASSQHVSLSYVVGSGGGLSVDSETAAYQVGERSTVPLSELNNEGFIPTLATITSTDMQLSFSHDTLSLRQGRLEKTTMTISADTPGKYDSTIHIGIFYPLLPASWIYALAKWNYWIALIAISLIPGLPLMAYPLIDSRMRAIVMKSLRKTASRITG